MQIVPPRFAAIAAGLLLTGMSLSAGTLTHEHAAQASRPRVYVLDETHVVVSLDLDGDLPGTVTFNFERQADGSITGNWAAMIAYADSTDPASGAEPEDHDQQAKPEGGESTHAHKDFLRLFHRGAVSGAIDSATLTFDASGALSAMSASMSIAQGTLEFTGASGGTGSASLTQFRLVF